MRTLTPASGDGLLRIPQDFSLVLGEPLLELLRRAHLIDDVLMLLRQRLLAVPAHPVRVGGVGFLSNTANAFFPLTLADAALLAGMIATCNFSLAATLPDIKVEIAVMVGFLVGAVLGSLLVFAPQLDQAKRTAKNRVRRPSGRCASSTPNGCVAACPPRSRS